MGGILGQHWKQLATGVLGLLLCSRMVCPAEQRWLFLLLFGPNMNIPVFRGASRLNGWLNPVLRSWLLVPEIWYHCPQLMKIACQRVSFRHWKAGRSISSRVKNPTVGRANFRADASRKASRVLPLNCWWPRCTCLSHSHWTSCQQTDVSRTFAPFFPNKFKGL